MGYAANVLYRHIASHKDFLRQIEKGFKACAAAGALPPDLHAKEAALGALSLVSGLIANWVLDPKSFSLEKHAANLVDTYFRGLATSPPPAARPARRAPARKKP